MAGRDFAIQAPADLRGMVDESPAAGRLLCDQLAGAARADTHALLLGDTGAGRRPEAAPAPAHVDPRGSAVRREVWQRDGSRCTYVDSQGHRYRATARHFRYWLVWLARLALPNLACFATRTLSAPASIAPLLGVQSS